MTENNSLEHYIKKYPWPRRRFIRLSFSFIQIFAYFTGKNAVFRTLTGHNG